MSATIAMIQSTNKVSDPRLRMVPSTFVRLPRKLMATTVRGWMPVRVPVRRAP